VSGEPLSIRTFAEVFRERMNKTAYIRNFDYERKTFETIDYAWANNEPIDASDVYPFYKLLLDSVIYLAQHEEVDGIPDIAAPMTTQLKNGNAEIHSRIKSIAQNVAKNVVADYFEANLIANIPPTVLPTVLDNVDMLIQGDTLLGPRKRRALKAAYNRESKSDAEYLAEVWIFTICNCKNKADEQIITKAKKEKNPIKVIDEAEKLLALIPAPPTIEPPTQIQDFEQPYINELYAAYGDKEKISGFGEAHLADHALYADDIKVRRIDYFSAESIRRGVMEIYGGNYANQFDVLKTETYAGVRNTVMKSFPNGFERMLEVMEKAAGFQTAQYLLTRSPNWISNRIKMGVCHFLVNDKKIWWVDK